MSESYKYGCPGVKMTTAINLDLNSKGSPPVMLTLPESGTAVDLLVTIEVDGEAVNDYSTDLFEAVAGEKADPIALTVAVLYVTNANATLLTITFPGSLPDRGRFVLRWFRTGRTAPIKLLNGDYLRDDTASAWPVD